VMEAATARHTVDGWDVAILTTWSRVLRCRRDRCPIEDSNSASGGDSRRVAVEVTCFESGAASKSADGWPESERRISWSMLGWVTAAGRRCVETARCAS
jgi:hypothetical protein